MVSKKVWKISILSLGTVSIFASSTYGIVYALRLNKKKSRILQPNNLKMEKKEPKIEKITLEQIIDGEIIDFKVEDYMGFIKSIKNGETTLSSLINGEILSWMESIDDNTYKIILNIILNKGLLDINNKDEEAIAKVLSIFFKNNKWFKFIKYIPLPINNGINEIITKDDNVLLNELLPFWNKVANELIKKPENKETKKQKTKRLANLSEVIRKFLISGYNDKSENDKIVETALEQMTNDVLKIIYLVVDEKKIPIIDKPIIKNLAYGIVKQLFEPSSKRIKMEINDLEKKNYNDVYAYETQYKITEETLKANNLLKGKGILFLSQKEIEHILYKIKDLSLNINSYIDTSYDRAIEASKKKTVPTIKLLLDFGKGTIKSKIEKIVTADLKNNFKFIDFIKIANILYKISNTGLKDIEVNDVLYLVNVIKKFNKDFDDKIKLSNGDIINIYNVLKKGFNSLKRPNKISILIKILDFTNIPNHIKAFIKPIINSWTITNENY